MSAASSDTEAPLISDPRLDPAGEQIMNYTKPETAVPRAPLRVKKPERIACSSFQPLERFKHNLSKTAEE
jgi:hypothetical protein